MLKLFFDTNIFIRFFTVDDPVSYQDCVQLIDLIQKGKITPYISNMVVLECYFVLQKTYHFPQDKVQAALSALLNLRNLVLTEQTNTPQAFGRYQTTHVKLNECLIASQLRPGMTLCTYDQEFKKLPEINSQTPAEILQKVADSNS